MLTGFSLSATQLSAYLYNIAVLVIIAICFPHIRRETPLPNLVLAWLYIFDTVANGAYTTVFAVSWYVAVKAGKYGVIPGAKISTTATAASTLAVAATMVESTPTSTVVHRDREALATATTSVAAAIAQATATASSSVAAATAAITPTAGSGGWMGAHETGASLTVVVIVTVMRIYFGLVVMSCARRALQLYMERVADQGPASDDGGDNGTGDDKREGASRSASRGDAVDDDIDDEEAGLKSGTRSSRGRHGRRHAYARRYNRSGSGGGGGRNPFEMGSVAGEGWKGKIGRALVTVGRGYWLNRERDDNWTRDIGTKLRSP